MATATRTTVESGDDAFPETHNEVFHRQERSFFPALLQALKVRPGLPRAKFEDTLDVGEDGGQTEDPAAQDRELVPRTRPRVGRVHGLFEHDVGARTVGVVAETQRVIALLRQPIDFTLDTDVAFGPLLRPLVEDAVERLHASLSAEQLAHLSPGAMANIVDHLRKRLSNLCELPLYEVLLGASDGPRFGGFIALYGVEETVALMERALRGELVA